MEPFALRPPVPLALARPVEAIPPAAALPGGCLYEPKWDGFRAAVYTGHARVAIYSRAGKDLSASFPDLTAAIQEQVPPDYVLDAEAVIWSGERLDFAALQARMTAGHRTLKGTIHTAPASLVVFDLLAVAGTDVRRLPLRHRRELLKELALDWRPPLNLSAATSNPKEAARWFSDFAAAGIEGIVAKGLAQPYIGGTRQWLKVRHRHPVDVVCAAVTGTVHRPETLILGLKVNGRLRVAGRTVPLRENVSRFVGQMLEPAGDGHPWPQEVTPRILDRFTDRTDPVHLTRVKPVTVEISADTAFENGSFRHPVRFLRTRPDLDPDSL